MTQEEIRLSESGARRKHWKRWGPYLSERAWGTVREDYSQYGTAWENLSHDHARSRAYRWNEDGLAGISDRKQTICFALALWNEPRLTPRTFSSKLRSRTAGPKWPTFACCRQFGSATHGPGECAIGGPNCMSRVLLPIR